jgi:hypothetical protein
MRERGVMAGLFGVVSSLNDRERADGAHALPGQMAWTAKIADGEV